MMKDESIACKSTNIKSKDIGHQDVFKALCDASHVSRASNKSDVTPKSQGGCLFCGFMNRTQFGSFYYVLLQTLCEDRSSEKQHGQAFEQLHLTEEHGSDKFKSGRSQFTIIFTISYDPKEQLDLRTLFMIATLYF